MKKNRRRWQAALGAAGAVSAALLFGCSKGSGDTASADTPTPAPVAVEISPVASHPMEEAVQAEGTIAAASGAMSAVDPGITGRVKAILVKDGDHVTQGQIIALLDNKPLEAQAGSAAQALTVAQQQAKQSMVSAEATAADQSSALEQATLTLSQARSDLITNVQIAKTALKTAQTNLLKLDNGSRPQEVAQAQQAVTQAQATSDKAALDQKRYKTLYDKGYASLNQLNDTETSYKVAEANLESAKQALSLVQAGPRAEDKQAAQLAVQQAQQALQQAQTDGQMRVALANTALLQAKHQALQVQAAQLQAQAMLTTVGQKQADLASAQATAGYAVIRSPLNGVVTKRNYNPGDYVDLSNPVVPIVEIVDLSRLNLVARIPATEGVKVQMGMTAHVTTTDFPGQVFAGRVINVGQVDPQTNLLTVHIAVANPKSQLRPGEFATASIVLRDIPNAVTIPKTAVLIRKSQTCAFTMGSDGKAHLHYIAIGAEQNGLEEVKSGLKPGEKVITLGQYELEDGQEVKLADTAPAAASSDSDSGE